MSEKKEKSKMQKITNAVVWVMLIAIVGSAVFTAIISVM